MNSNRKDWNDKFRIFLLNNKDIILGTLGFLFLLLSVISMCIGLEITTIGFIVAAGVVLIVVFPGIIESVRFGNLEMKMREVNDRVAEVRDLAKLLAEIAIPLAHHSVGWAETAPSTVQMKDAVIGRVLSLKETLGVEMSDDVLETHYVKTCGDYVYFIMESLGKDQKSNFYSEIGPMNIPIKIEDVLSPQRIKDALKKLEYWDDYVENLVEDYEHYYKNRTHRNQSRWKHRAEWRRPRGDREGDKSK